MSKELISSSLEFGKLIKQCVHDGQIKIELATISSVSETEFKIKLMSGLELPSSMLYVAFDLVDKLNYGDIVLVYPLSQQRYIVINKVIKM